MGPLILIFPWEILLSSGDRLAGSTLGECSPLIDLSSDRFGMKWGVMKILFQPDLSNKCGWSVLNCAPKTLLLCGPKRTRGLSFIKDWFGIECRHLNCLYHAVNSAHFRKILINTFIEYENVQVVTYYSFLIFLGEMMNCTETDCPASNSCISYKIFLFG